MLQLGIIAVTNVVFIVSELRAISTQLIFIYVELIIESQFLTHIIIDFHVLFVYIVRKLLWDNIFCRLCHTQSWVQLRVLTLSIVLFSLSTILFQISFVIRAQLFCCGISAVKLVQAPYQISQNKIVQRKIMAHKKDFFIVSFIK